MFLTLLDIGGSNTRIAFKKISENNNRVKNNKTIFDYDYSFDYYFKTKTNNINDIKDFVEKNYLLFKKTEEELGNKIVSLNDSIILVSFAGPVEINEKYNYKLTNNNLILKKDFFNLFKKHFILNDLEAVAYRMKKILDNFKNKDDLKVGNNNIDNFDFKKEFVEKNTFVELFFLKYDFNINNIFVVKPGTGLGSSFIFKNSIIPLELGFFPYSVLLEEDEDFKKFLEIKNYKNVDNNINDNNKSFVAFEEFCSSKSLVYYYYFNYNKILKPEDITFEYESSVEKKQTINFFIKRVLYFSYAFSKSLNSNTIILSGNIIKAVKKEFFKNNIFNFLDFLKNFFDDKNVFIILEKDQNLKGLLDFYFEILN